MKISAHSTLFLHYFCNISRKITASPNYLNSDSIINSLLQMAGFEISLIRSDGLTDANS